MLGAGGSSLPLSVVAKQAEAIEILESELDVLSSMTGDEAEVKSASVEVLLGRFSSAQGRLVALTGRGGGKIRKTTHPYSNDPLLQAWIAKLEVILGEVSSCEKARVTSACERFSITHICRLNVRKKR